MAINDLEPIDLDIHEVQATIGIGDERVLLECCYEDHDALPTIYKVIFKDIDIMGCLSEEVIGEMEIYADQVLKTLFYNERGLD